MAYWIWGGGALAGVLGLAVLAAVLGTAYQVVSEKADLARHPPPGRLVDVGGGRRLHLQCRRQAEGRIVVIEAGAGNDSTLWAWLLPQIATFATACTYDRAGLGWSDPLSRPMTIEDRANDLHSLLVAANLRGPVVLVGHSYGGYIIRTFADRYPEQVAAMVLVESAEEVYTFDPWGMRYAAEVCARERRVAWAARLGLLRLCVKLFPTRCNPVRGVPPDVRDEMTALYLRTSRHLAAADEMTALEKVPQPMRRSGGFGTLRDMPLVVITRASIDPNTKAPTQPEWLAAQQRLRALSSRASHVVAERSGHMVQFSEPQVIVEAIRTIWAQSR